MKLLKLNAVFFSLSIIYKLSLPLINKLMPVLNKKVLHVRSYDYDNNSSLDYPIIDFVSVNFM